MYASGARLAPSFQTKVAATAARPPTCHLAALLFQALPKLPAILLLQFLPAVGHGLATFPRQPLQPALAAIPAQQSAAAAVAPVLASQRGAAATAEYCAFCGASIKAPPKGTPGPQVSCQPSPACTCARCGVPAYCCPDHQQQDWPRHQLTCHPAAEPAAPT